MIPGMMPTETLAAIDRLDAQMARIDGTLDRINTQLDRIEGHQAATAALLQELPNMGWYRHMMIVTPLPVAAIVVLMVGAVRLAEIL
jgi:hypothetical protein